MTGDNPKLDIWTSFRFSRDESNLWCFFPAELAYAATATEQIGIWSTKYRWGYGLIGRVLLRSQSLIWDPVCHVVLSARPGSGLLSEFSLCPCLCMDIIQTSEHVIVWSCLQYLGDLGCSYQANTPTWSNMCICSPYVFKWTPRILDSLDHCIRTAKASWMTGDRGSTSLACELPWFP